MTTRTDRIEIDGEYVANVTVSDDAVTITADGIDAAPLRFNRAQIRAALIHNKRAQGRAIHRTAKRRAQLAKRRTNRKANR